MLKILFIILLIFIIASLAAHYPYATRRDLDLVSRPGICRHDLAYDHHYPTMHRATETLSPALQTDVPTIGYLKLYRGG